MQIEFEFNATRDFDFVQVFAKRFHQTVTHNKVMLPGILGKGYIKEVYLKNGISLCIHKYVLKQDFVLKRLESDVSEMLTIKFARSGFFTQEEAATPSLLYRESHSAEMITNNLFTQAVLPQNKDIDFVVINISRTMLTGLLELEDTALKDILLHNPSFIFYENMDVEMERTVLQMQAIDSAATLGKLQYQTKTYELIYQLISKIIARHITTPIPVNQSDAEQIYALKTAMLANLGVAPQLPVLARRAGMSETKMKRLFNQIFGQSIYNYFQSARMNEAARLLSTLTVSETGYRLGFTNLSHFSRLFEKHHHVKPKRYKDSVSAAKKNVAPVLNEVPDTTNL